MYVVWGENIHTVYILNIPTAVTVRLVSLGEKMEM